MEIQDTIQGRHEAAVSVSIFILIHPTGFAWVVKTDQVPLRVAEL